jgi:hypothetical protein
LETAPTRKPIMSLTRANCAQLFFIYTGRAHAVMNFLDLIQKSGLGNRNIALIRDPYAENYNNGVSPEIPDLESLLDWHDAHLRSHPHVSELYAIGNSSGAYGAILFGHLLGVRKVFVFGPRTARLSTADAAKAFLKELISVGNGVTEYFIHFAPSNKRDRAFAEYFEDSPGVVLCPYRASSIPGTWDHAVMNRLMDSGEIRALMPPYVPHEPPRVA